MTKTYFISSPEQPAFKIMRKLKPGALEELLKAVDGTVESLLLATTI